MHNINKPWAIIIIIRDLNIKFKIVVRYIFIWWKAWLHLNIEFYNVKGRGIADEDHELVYHLWLDITPPLWFKVFLLIAIIFYLYRVWTVPELRKYWYIEYTAYRYNFFDNIEWLLKFWDKLSLRIKNLIKIIISFIICFSFGFIISFIGI